MTYDSINRNAMKLLRDNTRLCLLLVVILRGPQICAQVGTATLNGTVTDPSGSVVPNATLVLESEFQKFSRTTITDQRGEFVIPSIPPGEYRLMVSAASFRPQTQTAIRLSSGQASTLNFALAVSDSQQTITVSEAPPLLQTANATLGTAMGAKQVAETPLLGRAFVNLLLLAPGVAPVQPAGSTTTYNPTGQNLLPSINGQRQKDNNFTLDGVDNRDPNLLGVPLYPPPEAIAEMKVESGMSSAVYGRASGAGVNVVTKSGSTEYHGDLWEYFRNNVLDARSFFVPKLGAFRWNQFGAAAGGPLLLPRVLSREKAWYVFGYYEGVRIRRASNVTAFVPTPAEVAGDFSASATPIYDPFSTAAGANGTQARQPFAQNRIPANMINRAAQTIAQAFYPAPNLPAGQIPGVNYLNTAPSATNGDQWSARADHQFTQKDSFFSRYSEAKNTFNSVGLPALTNLTQQRVTNVVVSDTHVLSPAFLITGRFGMSRTNNQASIPALPGVAAKAGTLDVFPAFHGAEIVPPLSITGYAGISQGPTIVGPLYQLSWLADAQKVYGAHTFEFGGGFIKTSVSVDDQTGTSVSFTSKQTANFNNSSGLPFASFILGLPDAAGRTAGSTQGDVHSHALQWYVQDNWRASRKLTVNLGLRWEYAAPAVNNYGLGTFLWETGQYVWDQKNPITGAPANVRKGGIDPDYNNFAPRLGLAYQVNDKTVVRSFFGMFYNTFGSNYIQSPQGARGNWPFAFPQSVAGLNTGAPNAIFPNPFPGPAAGSATPLGCKQCLNLIHETSRTPYVMQWSFSVQRQLTGTLALETSYFGSKGVKLVGQIVDNTAVVPGPGPYQQRQKWPQFAPYVTNGMNIFPSWYHAISVKLDKRFARRHSFLVSYTFSKNLDILDNLSNSSLGGAPTSNPTRINGRQNKGVAGFDVPQNFVASYIFDIPSPGKNRWVNYVLGEWSMSGVFSRYSGLPFMTFIGTDNENIGTVSGRSTQYPNLVGDPNAIARRTPNLWFNTAAFAVPAPFTVGNAGRNIVRTDGLTNLDFALYKRWKFLETRHVELRGESFNLLNHPSFGYPGTVVATPQFGKVSNTRNSGRQMQLALKVQF